MDLIERYLTAVGLLIPAGQRADILAELREALLSQREEKEDELGRALTAEEQQRLLDAFGDPMTVAARYGAPRYLIGPELYPLYALMLKLVLIPVAIAAIAPTIVIAVTTGDLGAAIGRGVGVAINGFLSCVGSITLVFAGLQRSPENLRRLREWSARDMAELSKLSRLSELSNLGKLADGGRRRWFEDVTGIVAQLIFVLWWTHVIPFWRSNIPVHEGQSVALGLAPVWDALFWPVLALSGLDIAIHALRLATPEPPRAALAFNLALQLGLLAAVGWALRAGRWVVVTGVGLPAEALAKVAYGVNLGIHVTLIVLAVVAIASAGVSLLRLARPASTQAA
jgi:hypothetical protein